MSWFESVLHFHDAFGQLIGTTPKVPDQKVVELRNNLHAEEYLELSKAILDNDLPGIADGIADLIYVLLGTAISYGIDMDKVFSEVHKANMAKAGGGKREDGKVIKPLGWKPPDIKGLLLNQKEIVCSCYLCKLIKEADAGLIRLK